MSAVRLDLISALGQAQEHQERANTAYDALREIEAIVRGPSSDTSMLSGIAAILSNGPLDTAPGGPREDECARLIAERDQYRDALEQIADREPHDSSQPAQAHALAVARVHARAALSRERKDTDA